MQPCVPEPAPDWARAQPEAAGLSAAALEEAVGFAQAHKSDWPRSMYLPDGRFAARTATA